MKSSTGCCCCFWLLTRLTRDDLLMRSKHVLEMTATCSICNAADEARRQTPPHLVACKRRMRVKTPRVVAAVAFEFHSSFPRNRRIVSLRLRPTCLPLTILAAAISLLVPEDPRRTPDYVYVRLIPFCSRISALALCFCVCV